MPLLSLKGLSWKHELEPVVSIAEKPSLQIGYIERGEVDQPTPVKRETEKSPVCPLVFET